MKTYIVLLLGSVLLNGIIIGNIIVLVNKSDMSDAVPFDKSDLNNEYIVHKSDKEPEDEVIIVPYLETKLIQVWPDGNTLSEIREVGKLMSDLGCDIKIIKLTVGPRLDEYYTKEFYDIFKYRTGIPWRQLSYGVRDQGLLNAYLVDLLSSRDEDLESEFTMDLKYHYPTLYNDSEIYDNHELIAAGISEEMSNDIHNILDDGSIHVDEKYEAISDKFGNDVALSVKVCQNPEYRLLQKLVSLYNLGDDVSDEVFTGFKESQNLHNSRFVLNNKLSSILSEEVFRVYKSLM